jgi:glycosyltransferase involved in cell wall biosynthesis
MKILYIVSEFDPVQNAVAIRTKSNIDALLKEHHDVQILTGPRSKKNLNYNVITTRVSPPSNKAKFLLRLIQEIIFGLEIGLRVIFLKKYDHIVMTSPPFIMTAIVSFFIYLKKVPYSLDIRDRYPQVMFSLKLISKNSLLGRWLLKLEKNLYSRATNVITVTDSLVYSIKQELGIGSVKLVSNGFSNKIFTPSITKLKTDVPIIIIHGTFGQFFDESIFMNIVKALDRKMVQYKIIMIGEGHKLEMIKNNKFNNVEVWGQMNQSKLNYWIQSAHLGLSIHTDNNSMRGAFPVKIFEYIGCGIPSVVIPLNEGGKRVELEGMGFSCGSEDWMSAVEMIQQLLKDTKYYNEIVNNISKKRKLFSREHQAKVFVDILT